MTDYKKLYEEALDNFKKIKAANKDNKELVNFIEYEYPELKESEDEKIRKHLISLVKNWDKGGIIGKYTSNANDIKQILAWLDKQGEQNNLYKVPSREVILAIWELGNEWKELTNGAIATEHGTQLDYIRNHWYENEYLYRKNLKDSSGKSVDESKPKFKVGDWVINKQDIVHQISNVEKIVANNTYGYGIVGGGYFNDETEGVRLWTIEDAKDGDILADEVGTILFRKIGNEMYPDVVDYYCVCVAESGRFEIQKKVAYWGKTEDAQLHPATKEQRDTLERVMTNAGYRWDKEKLKLEKI